MKKEKIFSKFNTRTFNNELEEVLSIKPFSENTKNNILNMIYKIEEAYNDYKIVKVEVQSEKAFLETILESIKKYCNLINISTSNLINEKKYIVDYEEGEIKVISNNIWILYSIIEILKNIKNNQEELDIIQEKPLYDLLSLGYNINKIEVLRDFNGWSWVKASNELGNTKINLVYQNLQFLLGNKFFENYMENIIITSNNFTKILEDRLRKKYDEKVAKDIINLFRKISILEIANINEEYKTQLVQIKEKKLEEYNLMENKKEYLKEISLIKKENIEIIKNIDKLINNTELLRNEYRTRNSKLKNSDKIFSVSCLVDILNNERKEAFDKITEVNNLMEPKTYVRKKEELQDLIDELSVESKVSDEYIIKLQKIFINCMIEEINILEEKTDIIKSLYKVRYYINISFSKEKDIKDSIELKNDVEKLKKAIIEKLVKNKLIFEFSEDIETNKKILINILDTRIINFQKVYLLLKKDNEKIKIEIYDEDELYRIQEIDLKDINYKSLKLNKKIKLFS